MGIINGAMAPGAAAPMQRLPTAIRQPVPMAQPASPVGVQPVRTAPASVDPVLYAAPRAMQKPQGMPVAQGPVMYAAPQTASAVKAAASSVDPVAGVQPVQPLRGL